MSRRLMLVALAITATAAVASSCRNEPEPDPIPAGVPGSYVYAASGSALNKLTWQIEANLNLSPEGTFTLTLDKTVNGKRDPTEKASGTYTVADNKVWITVAQNSRPRRHSLEIRPDSLVGKIGWTAHMVLRGIGAPDPVLVKRQRI